jgi:hypothetical protein
VAAVGYCAQAVFEELRVRGYTGGYDTVPYFPAVQFLGLGFLGSRFNFFHASAATCLVKKAHDSQDRGRGDDHPFCPCSRPPEYGQNNNSCSQQKPTETKLHDLPSFFIELNS